MSETSIEWTDVTWNPVRGCSRVSEGCRNCYAERMAVRMSGPGQWGEGFADAPRRHPQTGAATTGVRGHWTGKVELVPSKLEEPLHWRKPRKVFVNSMSDLFHEALGLLDILRVFEVMVACQQHTFQVLTKRPDRMRDFVRWWFDLRNQGGVPPKNIWLGVSIEDQATADLRIPLLLQTSAAVRFVSYEPALGPVNFNNLKDGHTFWTRPAETETRALDWVIVGGESGPGARPFHVWWARSTVRQCRDAGVAVFVKQFGAHPLLNSVCCSLGCGEDEPLKLRSPKGGDMAEWPADLRVREFPVAEKNSGRTVKPELSPETDTPAQGGF